LRLRAHRAVSRGGGAAQLALFHLFTFAYLAQAKRVDHTAPLEEALERVLVTHFWPIH
jgi:hypothetical protein